MEPEHAAPPSIDLAAVFETAPMGLGVIGPDGRYLIANRALARLVDRKPEEVVGAVAVEFLHPDDRKAGEYAMARLMDGTVDEAAEDLRYLRRSGTVVFARFTAAALRDKNGAATALVLQTEDVTTERAAAEAQAEMSSLVAVLDEAVMTVSSQGRIRSWNAAAERLLGWSAAEVVGQPVDSLVPPDRAGEVPEMLARFESGESVRSETAWVHKDGSLVDIGLTATPILDATSRVVSAISVLHDIAEQKRAAARLEHLARHDPLTGLPNRREFSERLQQAMLEGRRKGEVVGLLFVDLDGFKEVNDTHGHQVGDEFLRVIGARLHGAIRPADTLARWGGDEYAVLVEHAEGVDDLTAVARRLLDTLARPIHIRGYDFAAAASIGIATSSHATTPDAMLHDADHAMYRAKNRGGNQYAVPPGAVPSAPAGVEDEPVPPDEPMNPA